MVQFGLPHEACKHRRIRGHHFYDSPGSHSTWRKTSNNKNQVWELLSHAERAPLDLDVFPVFLPVSLECGNYWLRETELTLKRLHFWRTLNAPNKILQGKTKYTLTMKYQPGHFLQDTHRHRPSCWQQVMEKSWPQCPNGETEGKTTPQSLPRNHTPMCETGKARMTSQPRRQLFCLSYS